MRAGGGVCARRASGFVFCSLELEAVGDVKVDALVGLSAADFKRIIGSRLPVSADLPALADWDIKAGDAFTVSPFTGITYMYGTQGPIEETFDGGSRSFGNGGLQSWSIPVGITLKSVCGLGNGQALLPELSVAYVGDIARRNPCVQ